MPTAPYRENRGLFSTEYLDERLSEMAVWNGDDETDLRTARDGITTLFEREKEALPHERKCQFEKRFVRPVFRALGIPFAVNDEEDGPDYEFFESETEESPTTVAIADTTRWGQPLDTPPADEHGNPSYRIHTHLQETSAEWGVLTNGKQWRLYHDTSGHRFDTYYEIDISVLLETENSEAFKQFHLLFRHEAFVEDADGTCFLDNIYDESATVVQQLRDDLTNNVYEAIPVFAEGLIDHPDNDLTETDLDLIFDSTLVYLYRLVVALYAESEGYGRLNVESVDQLEDSPHDDLWSRLEDLFGRIDEGSEILGPQNEDRSVPAYNGWLFRTEPIGDQHPETRLLAQNRVEDGPLTRTIELLTNGQNDDGVEMNYSSLDVRHLGRVYEELLEYELHVADEPLLLVDGEYVGVGNDDRRESKDGGNSTNCPSGENSTCSTGRGDTTAKKTTEEIVVQKGELYLTTGSGKRKATGSYYTPEYVVEHIVENTLGPLVDDIRSGLNGNESTDEFLREILDLTVLDPAMGTGHFLRAAVDYLAYEIITNQDRRARNGTVEHVRDINWARRQVAQRCVYGVDQNPLAVELGTVSLWLWTLTDEQPSFFDPHLKTGNALVGSGIEAIEELTARQGSLAENDRTEPITDESDVHEAKASQRTFEQDLLYNRLRAVANVKTAESAGHSLPDGVYDRMATAVSDDAEWEAIEATSWFQTAQQRAKQEQYFHWALEFPECYSEGLRPSSSQTQSGDSEERSTVRFDAVIGNPPYLRSRNLKAERKAFYESRYRTAGGSYDSYILFMELAATLGRRCSFIVPNKWTTTGYGESLRGLLLDEWTLHEVVDISHLPVFPDTNVYPLIVTYSNHGPNTGTEAFTVRRVEHATALDTSPSSVTVPRSIIDHLGGRVIPINLSSVFIPILQRVLREETTLGDHVVMNESIHTGNVRDKLVVDEAVGAECEKLTDGTSIRRYHVEWNGRWIRHDAALIDSDSEEYANLRDRALFDRDQKLFVRDISYRPVAAYDDSRLFALNTVYTVTRKPDTELGPKYLLAVFNSEFVDRYFRQVYGGTHVGGEYLRFKPMFTHAIPVPSPNDRALPPERKRRLRAFDPAIETESVDETVAQLTDVIRDAIERKQDIHLIPTELLEDDPGREITHVTGYRRVAGTDSPLGKTADDLDGLRIGSIDIVENEETVTILASARYKPAGNTDETDRWGYTETELLPAIEFVGVGDTERFLVREIVQHAVQTGGGVAGFRERATKTYSLIDRLEAIRVPVIDEGNTTLVEYRNQVRTVNELDERIRTADQFIDEIVYDLYGLSPDEKRTVKQLDD